MVKVVEGMLNALPKQRLHISCSKSDLGTNNVFVLFTTLCGFVRFLSFLPSSSSLLLLCLPSSAKPPSPCYIPPAATQDSPPGLLLL